MISVGLLTYWRNFMNWNEFQNLLSNIVFVILLLNTVIYWGYLSFSGGVRLFKKFGRICTGVANILIVVILGSRWIVSGYFPLSNLYESLLFLTWTLLTLQLTIEIKTNSKIIGSLIVPIVLLLTGFANLILSPEMQRSSPLIPALQSNWLMLHVSMMLISYATLILGSVLCLLFLVISKYEEIDLTTIENEELTLITLLPIFYQNTNFLSGGNGEHIQKLGKLKLLQTLDNWSYRIIGLGFPFLTVGIIGGGVWANEAWGSYWSWDPKETWALVTWLIFATYLHARITKGFKGKKTAILGSVGFFVIWVCYLGVNFLGKGLHSYGFI